MAITSLPLSSSQKMARRILQRFHWDIELNLPSERQYVIIGAPHTSNWDLAHALLIKYAAGLNMHWVGKDNLFWWPLGAALRKLGGIPVNRRSRNNFVQQMAEAFTRIENLVLAITPEGTRSKVHVWKTGFYYIAQAANVPIALGYVDYATRTTGIGGAVYPTGDIRADFEKIRAFYATKVGRWPEKQGAIELRER